MTHYFKAIVIVKPNIKVEMISSFEGNWKSGREVAEEHAIEVIKEVLPKGCLISEVEANCTEYRLEDVEHEDESDDKKPF